MIPKTMHILVSKLTDLLNILEQGSKTSQNKLLVLTLLSSLVHSKHCNVLDIMTKNKFVERITVLSFYQTRPLLASAASAFLKSALASGCRDLIKSTYELSSLFPSFLIFYIEP
jgi:hypothetical protein